MPDPESVYSYDDLFDIENRPGAGVRLWQKAVQDQVDRVVVASNHHRQNHAPDWMTIPEDQRLPHDPDAERRLHIEVYFLAISIRRVLLFHDAISKQIDDPDLRDARRSFIAAAPEIKDFRDYFEHLNEYLLGEGKAQKNAKIAADRVSPILQLTWGAPNVTIRFGDALLDVTAAGIAAVQLASVTSEVWERHLEAVRKRYPTPPADDDEMLRMIDTTFLISTVIGSDDDGHIVNTGVLREVSVRSATAEEISERRKSGSA